MAFESPAEISPASAPKVVEFLPRTLPVELHRDIVQNIDDRATLLALCTTSCAFKVEAERMLYRSMTQNLAQADVDKAIHLSFLQTMANAKHLAALVRTYHLQVAKVCILSANAQREFSDLIRSALRSMVNLCRLWLDLPSSVMRPDPFIFDHCSFQLESLQITQTQTTHELTAFLGTQRRLRELSVNLDNSVQPVPAAVCPHLEVLQGNRNTMNALLPRRQIKTLIYDPDTYEMNEPVSHLSEPLDHLLVLSLGGFYLRPSLHILTSFLRSLEYLELVSLHGRSTLSVSCDPFVD
ncbi:hypothetical protein CPB84DRAFT_1447358 [Gymnopilus junonius]|uniref:F-box domain-containing protein n=1 Tax=Gymnopilus junonius TaxID=109634 RepID=A0A9P5NKM7_GYMJU|nr:hypothetical protein CPB84DRAFT_1447358 [Gymnopilus junonius]